MEDFQATGNRELLTLRNIIASAKRDEYAIDANFNVLVHNTIIARYRNELQDVKNGFLDQARESIFRWN